MTNYTVDVIVNNKSVTTYSHEGQTFIEGRPKSEYKIKIRNYEPRRIKVVVSVDGLSIIDGLPASESSTGYVINAYDSLEIDGWRVDDNNVRKFVFGSKKDSYAAKSGQGTQNTGVIGIMAFTEKAPNTMNINHFYQKSPGWNDFNPSFSSGLRGIGMSSGGPVVGSIVNLNSIDVAASAASFNNVATEQGAEITSRVTSTAFTPEAGLATTKVIFYDDVKGLEARGIQVKKAIPASPNPFPASTTYCKRV